MKERLLIVLAAAVLLLSAGGFQPVRSIEVTARARMAQPYPGCTDAGSICGG